MSNFFTNRLSYSILTYAVLRFYSEVYDIVYRVSHLHGTLKWDVRVSGHGRANKPGELTTLCATIMGWKRMPLLCYLAARVGLYCRPLWTYGHQPNDNRWNATVGFTPVMKM